MDDTLTVTWTDPRGIVWDLTSGDRGVKLDIGQSGLGWSRIRHSLIRDDTALAASRVAPAELDLIIRLDDTKYAEDYYRLSSEWWEQANSPFMEGTLAVARPGRAPRTRRARLRESPGTTWPYDPGLRGQERPAELWPLLCMSPWWSGPEQEIAHRYNTNAPTRLYYTDDGHGWPLQIGASSHATGKHITNTGAGPMWPNWRIRGPMAGARVGVADDLLAVAGPLGSGDEMIIVTDPTRRAVWDVDTGDTLFHLVSGTWAPIPAGQRVPVVIDVDGIAPGAAIIATAAEQHAQAW
ncbi:hypothetical protein CSPHI_05045 [Corynebacterium sphenisci DSM 44792]|uniref:Phage tail protein n=1 Tax=Corynebacterium sphenisci DSM 44792 TaxID=1437874 RepID=A0A1L7CXB4_9CORY|nr:hypothetical protein [Corynebacterium sphenisci]APT90506.1 hypothetical protein CSPHI_05045 [Corynebacterium sphenisci DSM 44792]